MVVGVEIKGLKQQTLFDLCKKHGWDPLFFSSAQVDVNVGVLERELQVSSAAGEWNLCSLLLKAAREKADARLLKHLADFDQQGALEVVVKRKTRSLLSCLLLFRPYVRHQTEKSLRKILSSEMLRPEVFGRKKNADMAERWGLEMKYWYSQDNYKIVVALGERAEQLNLDHHLITRYLKISALALGRPKVLIVLKGIQQSPNRTRSDYEKAILDAWSVDPGFTDYLELLRKVIAFRMRKKKPQSVLLENFEQECIEFELNKKLAAFLSGS
tara:strand:+ start:73 stop:885 length:813 start_codon:yes stop_codon:yes gene_type:complete